MQKLTLGKTEARSQFLPLVDSLSKRKSAVEITDRGKPVAVLLDYSSYQALLAKSGMKTKPNFQLVGSLVELADIESASKEIAADLNKSIETTARNL